MAARSLLVSFALAAALASEANATPLFAVFVGLNPGAPPGSPSYALYEVDPTTGARSLVSLLPTRVWGDIAGRAGDAARIYGVSRVPGTGFLNQVSWIDAGSGAVTDLYSFTASGLGFASPYALELTGIAFDPFDSSVARILGVLVDNTFTLPQTAIRFDLDLGTGGVSALHVLAPSGGASDLTYAHDGTLFGLVPYNPNLASRLVTIDLASNLVIPIGTCALEGRCNLRAIEFDPISGALYAVDRNGSLLIVSPSTGAVLDVIGPTGLPNPGAVGSVAGLAFIPEPATGSLLAIGLAVLAAGRRRRR